MVLTFFEHSSMSMDVFHAGFRPEVQPKSSELWKKVIERALISLTTVFCWSHCPTGNPLRSRVDKSAQLLLPASEPPIGAWISTSVESETSFCVKVQHMESVISCCSRVIDVSCLMWGIIKDCLTSSHSRGSQNSLLTASTTHAIRTWW